MKHDVLKVITYGSYDDKKTSRSAFSKIHELCYSIAFHLSFLDTLKFNGIISVV